MLIWILSQLTWCLHPDHRGTGFCQVSLFIFYFLRLIDSSWISKKINWFLCTCVYLFVLKRVWIHASLYYMVIMVYFIEESYPRFVSIHVTTPAIGELHRPHCYRPDIRYVFMVSLTCDCFCCKWWVLFHYNVRQFEALSIIKQFVRLYCGPIFRFSHYLLAITQFNVHKCMNNDLILRLVCWISAKRFSS
jgi:hypothetical protein